MYTEVIKKLKDLKENFAGTIQAFSPTPIGVAGLVKPKDKSKNKIKNQDNGLQERQL